MKQHPREIALGTVFRRARVRAGLSQTALGQRLGITFQQVQKYEKATNRVHFARLLDLCEALGTTPETVLAEVRTLLNEAPQGEPQPDGPETVRLIGLAHRVDAPTRKAVIALLRARTGAAGEE